jgi:uptake hydrogenase large subunit
MNAAASIGALGPGALSIAAEIADDRICSIRVASTRRTNLARLFVGRSAEEAPLLAERIFSLCGVSHRVVATRAIAAARNEPICVRRVQAETIALLADRVSGAVRSNMLLALQGSDDAPGVARIRALGEILSLARDLSALALANSSMTGAARKAIRSLIRKICSLGREHALRAQDESVIPARAEASLFDCLERQFSNCRDFVANVPDALRADDDAEILQAVQREGEHFAATPALSGRAPETGAFARHWRRTDFSGGALAARFEARMIDFAESLELLERADKEGETSEYAVAPSTREGFAAVETSRGRLYHWVRLSSGDRIKNYQIVAPTEWNFHPAGPFVGALLGAAIEPIGAEIGIARLAGLIDPCVPFRVEVSEAAHA